MRTDLYGEISSRQRPSHQRSIIPAGLTAAVASLPISARKVFPACLPFICGSAGFALLDPALPCRTSATDPVPTDSMRQRPSRTVHPESAPLRIPTTTSFPHIALACQGLSVYPRRGYQEISRNANAVKYHFSPRGPPRTDWGSHRGASRMGSSATDLGTIQRSQGAAGESTHYPDKKEPG